MEVSQGNNTFWSECKVSQYFCKRIKMSCKWTFSQRNAMIFCKRIQSFLGELNIFVGYFVWECKISWGNAILLQDNAKFLGNAFAKRMKSCSGNAIFLQDDENVLRDNAKLLVGMQYFFLITLSCPFKGSVQIYIQCIYYYESEENNLIKCILCHIVIVTRWFQIFIS